MTILRSLIAKAMSTFETFPSVSLDLVLTESRVFLRSLARLFSPESELFRRLSLFPSKAWNGTLSFCLGPLDNFVHGLGTDLEAWWSASKDRPLFFLVGVYIFLVLILATWNECKSARESYKGALPSRAKVVSSSVSSICSSGFVNDRLSERHRLGVDPCRSLDSCRGGVVGVGTRLPANDLRKILGIFDLAKTSYIPGNSDKVLSQLRACSFPFPLDWRCPPASMTLLHCAILGGDARLVHRLVKMGSAVAARNANGDTCVYLAVYAAARLDHLRTNNCAIDASLIEGARTELCVLDVLISAGAEVSAANRDGHTPLHLAASHGDVGIVTFLLVHGADSAKRNASGQMPLSLALNGGHLEAAALLQRYMHLRIRRETVGRGFGCGEAGNVSHRADRVPKIGKTNSSEHSLCRTSSSCSSLERGVATSTERPPVRAFSRASLSDPTSTDAVFDDLEDDFL